MIRAKEKLKLTAALGLEQFFKSGEAGYLLPPGAGSRLEFLSLCNRCGNCQQACPNQAIVPLTIGATTLELGIPTLKPEERPCSMCLKCVAACPTGALSEKAPWQVGLARIDREQCLAWQNVYCGNCTHHCPHQGIDWEAKKPVINQANCLGCGQCVQSCLAPNKAISIVEKQTEKI